jgi:hypothetical protein
MDATTVTQARAEHQRRLAAYVRHLDRCRRCQSPGRPAVLARLSIAASWRQSGVGYDAGAEGEIRLSRDSQTSVLVRSFE